MIAISLMGNVDLVRAMYAAVPDWELVRSMLCPDVVLDQRRMPDGDVHHGRDAFGRFFERWFGTWDDLQFTPERFIEEGDRVLVLFRLEGRGKGSGVPVVIDAADIWTVRDGKIASLEGFPERAEALEELGLAE
jgi:ketosteroid isomerase-like protein